MNIVCPTLLKIPEVIAHRRNCPYCLATTEPVGTLHWWAYHACISVGIPFDEEVESLLTAPRSVLFAPADERRRKRLSVANMAQYAAAKCADARNRADQSTADDTASHQTSSRLPSKPSLSPSSSQPPSQRSSRRRSRAKAEGTTSEALTAEQQREREREFQEHRIRQVLEHPDVQALVAKGWTIERTRLADGVRITLKDSR